MSLGNGKLVYKVVNSGAVFDQVKVLSEAAARAGLSTEFAAALRFIMTRLQRSPNRFGVPRFHLQHHGLKVCSARHWMMTIEYAIDAATRTVHIRAIRPNPDTPLDTTSSP